MNTSDHHTMVQAISAAHATRLALPDTQPNEVVYTNDQPVYRAAKTACHSMSFIDIDAECLALAWQSQTARLGSFDATHWPDQPQDFNIKPWPRAEAFAPCPKNLGLYAVLPDAAWVGRMARAGAPTVQLRFKSDDFHAVEREVLSAVEAVRGTPALLFINDHWQAAIRAGAYGVHLGQEDLVATRSADLAAIRNAGLRLGVSSHGYAEMLRADQVSPSYVALGAVYATTLKRMVTPPQGPGRLHAYARLMSHYPLVAIGGIDLTRLDDVLASSVGSVAAVRALVAAEMPEAEAATWMQRLKR